MSNDNAEHETMLPTSCQFLDAVYESNGRKVKSLMKRTKVNPNVVDYRRPDHPTALLYCAEKGDVQMANILLKAKPINADVNKENNKGKRCIWCACEQGNHEMVELLIAHKCNVDYVDQQTGCTPLYRAVVTNSKEVCSLLVHAGADVNLRRLGYGTGAETPLIKAVQKNNLDICNILVNSLCDINYQTENGLTALHYAIAYRRYEIVECLLSNKIDLHAATKNGVTAMAVAIEHRNAHACRTLIEFGYSLDKPYAWGETPLEQAIKLHSEECAVTLVAWGCSLLQRAAQPRHQSYLYWAAQEGLMTLMEFLVDLNPTCLNEPWIRQQRPPLALYHKPKALAWLQAQARQVRTLVALCRASAYRHLCIYQPVKIRQLPLQARCMQYLLYPEYVSEKMYKKVLLKMKCPYDCDSQHATAEIQCADVEVSDVDSSSSSSSEPDAESAQAERKASLQTSQAETRKQNEVANQNILRRKQKRELVTE